MHTAIWNENPLWYVFIRNHLDMACPAFENGLYWVI